MLVGQKSAVVCMCEGTSAVETATEMESTGSRVQTVCGQFSSVVQAVLKGAAKISSSFSRYSISLPGWPA